MAETLFPVDTERNGKASPKGVFLTVKAKKEFAEIPARAATLLTEWMTQWAWATSADQEPRKKKFKRLGEFASKNPAKPSVNVCEFKWKATRVYGHERPVGMQQAAIVLVYAVLNDKGGAAGKRQDASIETAAKRAGDLYG